MGGRIGEGREDRLLERTRTAERLESAEVDRVSEKFDQKPEPGAPPWAPRPRFGETARAPFAPAAPSGKVDLLGGQVQPPFGAQGRDPLHPVTASQASPLMSSILDDVRGAMNRGTVPQELVYTEGNRPTQKVFLRGQEIFPEVARQLASTEHEFLLQTYDWEPGTAGQFVEHFHDGLRQLQSARERAGATQPVTVRVLVNERSPLVNKLFVGRSDVPSPALAIHQGVRELGLDPRYVRVEVAAHRQQALGSLHTKTFVKDGKLGILTGVNPNGGGWLDAAFALEGEVVSAMREDFAGAWKKGLAVGGEKSALEALPRGKAEAGNVPMLVASRKATELPNLLGRESLQEAAYRSLLQHAANRVRIMTPNLNDAAVQASILDACKRGLKVELLLSQGFNDQEEMKPLQGGTNQQVADRLMAQLTAIGKADRLDIRWFSNDGTKPVFAKEDATSHAKYASADGQISAVGSANMDTQSQKQSREFNVLVDDATTTAEWDAQLFEPAFERGIRWKPSIEPVRSSLASAPAGAAPRADLPGNAAAEILAQHFDQMISAVGSGNGMLRAADLATVAGTPSLPYELRSAAATLLRDNALRRRIDTGTLAKNADGTEPAPDDQISKSDLMTASGDLRSDLPMPDVVAALRMYFDRVDGAAGERHDALSREDLQRVVWSDAAPLELRSAALTLLKNPSMFQLLDATAIKPKTDGFVARADLDEAARWARKPISPVFADARKRQPQAAVEQSLGMTLADAQRGKDGTWFQRFERGYLERPPGGETRVISVERKIAEAIRAHPELGAPQGPIRPFGNGYLQEVESPRYVGGRALLSVNPEQGEPVLLRDHFLEAYESWRPETAGPVHGVFGLPVANETDGVQRFERGELTRSAADEAQVRVGAGNFASAVSHGGGPAAVGTPVDNGGGVPVHRWGGGWSQDFNGGTLGPSAVMMKDGVNDAYLVSGGIRDAYFAAGGATSPLGYPVENQEPGAQGQRFEHGVIERDPANGEFRIWVRP